MSLHLPLSGRQGRLLVRDIMPKEVGRCVYIQATLSTPNRVRLVEVRLKVLAIAFGMYTVTASPFWFQ